MSDVQEHAPRMVCRHGLPALRDDAASISPGRKPEPMLIDPRPCDLCGLTIDRHEMVDHGEGPEFFCADLSPDEMTLPELERRAELRRQEDIAGIFARLEAINGPAIVPRAEPEPYRPAASTVEAFRYLVAAGDVGHLKGWLADRPKDASLLLALLERPATC
jgi:hypothetical protein